MTPQEAEVGGQPWVFLLYAALAVSAVAGILIVSHLLGQRHRAPGKNLPYESGMNPTGTARLRYGIHFYPVGIFFILFDVEAVFLYAWAVAFRELGWAGYVEAALFTIVLFLGLVYIWREGGLDWSPSRRRSAAAEQSKVENRE
ncbi:MAG: NADH-quinone oxidoreductase subunit A [Armatimonadota bacterium]